jgi:DNA-binding NtrC family response regulator
LTTILTMLSSPDHADLRRILPEGLYTVREVESKIVLKRHLESPDVPLVVCDERNDWRGVLELCVDRFVPKVILCATQPSNELWAEMFNLGGYDLLKLPFDPDNLKRVIKHASFPLVKSAR